MHLFGRIKARTLLLLVLAGGVSACFYHFTGGGLPSHVKTMAVVPFDNQTAVSDIQREISDSLRSKLENRLGLSEASVDKANAVVRGTIRQYQVDIPVGVNAGTRVATASTRRMLQIVLDIDVTDEVTGKSLWSKKSFTVTGQYDEQEEAKGRSEAIDRVVNAIVEGVQSQW
jgi:hypothetical protein